MNTDKSFTVLCTELEAILTSGAQALEPWEENKAGKDAVALYYERIVEPAKEKIKEMERRYDKINCSDNERFYQIVALQKKLRQIGEIANGQ